MGAVRLVSLWASAHRGTAIEYRYAERFLWFSRRLNRVKREPQGILQQSHIFTSY